MKEALRTKHVLALALVGAVLVVGSPEQCKAQLPEIGPILLEDLPVSNSGDVWSFVDVAFDGSRYLIVWERNTTTPGEIGAQFVLPDGTKDGDPIFFTQRNNRPIHKPSVAFDGTKYMVVYHVNSDPFGSPPPYDRIGGVSITPEGVVSDEFGIGASNTTGGPEIASNGDNFLVVWHRTGVDDFDIFGQLVDSDGSLIGTAFGIGPTTGRQSHPSVASDGDGYLVTWAEGSSAWDVWGATVSGGGTVSDGFPICTASGTQGSWRHNAITFGGDNYLVVWEHYAVGIYAARISLDGLVLDPEGFLVSDNWEESSPRGVSAVYDGVNYLVAWGGSHVNARRVDVSGGVLDTDDIPLYKNYRAPQYGPSLSFDGSGYLVAWVEGSGAQTAYAQIVSTISQPPTNQPPVADAGPDQTVEGTSPSGAEVSLDGSDSSDDGQIQPLTYSWTWVGGSATGVSPVVTLPLGSTTVTLTVDDGEFTDADTVEITVVDTTAPTITCPQSIEMITSDLSGVPATDPAIQAFLAGALATDLCDPAPVISDNAPSLFPVGVTTVTFTAADSSGNESSCAATVTVTYEAPQDTTPPEIESIIADPGVLWPPNHKMVEVVVLVDAWDNSGKTPDCSISEITSNESINGPGDGNTEPDWDWQDTDDPLVFIVWLRAESNGTGNGRIYTIEIECWDASGNESNEIVQVIVPHDQGKEKN